MTPGEDIALILGKGAVIEAHPIMNEAGGAVEYQFHVWLNEDDAKKVAHYYGNELPND